MSDNPDDELVGYGQPPQHSRFKPGQSGNPKGRPKGSQNLGTLVQKELKKRIPVTINGRETTITKAEAIVTQLVNDSAKSNPRARGQLIPLIQGIDQKSEGEASAALAIDPDDQKVATDLLKRLRRTPLDMEKHNEPELD